VFGIAFVVDDAGDLGFFAGGELSAAAGLADGAMASDPTDADALSFGPIGHTFAYRIDDTGNFVAGDSRVSQAWNKAILS
jgi:hypothetical protein